ncbi:hypothetical protein ACO0K3_03600 [Undibacterium sp. Rencai35W]|uniref:hypothetical protein n=1 Tax=Undibacterium sp. Rencai35W TaxID=3413046 RepID=UPI003BF081B9
MGKNSAPAPDYTPVANASKETAELSAKLGQAQLDENKRQYEETKLITAPIIEKQSALMDQTKQQGDAYFNRWKEGQTVTDALKNDVMTDNSARNTAERNSITQSIKDAAAGYQNLAAGQNAFGEKQASTIRAAEEKIAADSQADVGKAADRIGDSMNKYGGDVQKAIDLYTAGNGAINEKYGADIEQDVGKAVADARSGQAQASNQAMRQAIRYGLSVPDAAATSTLAQSQQLAASANGARTDATNNYRTLVGNSVGMKQNVLNTGVTAATADAGLRSNAAINAAGLKSSGESQALQSMQTANTQALGLNTAAIDKIATVASTARDLRRQDEATDMAKKLDVAGMYSGMTGASAGAYSQANTSGNSAVGNQNSTAGQYLNGMNAGTNTILTGQQAAMGGLGSILSSQTSVYNNSQGEGFGAILGGVGGVLTGAAKAGIIGGSMREYKENIVLVGKHPIGIPLYQFNYLPQFAEKWGYGNHVGVMVDELIHVMPDAISKDIDGHTVVNYKLLGGVNHAA